MTASPTGQTALRDRIASVAVPFFANFSDEEAAKINAGELADAVMAEERDEAQAQANLDALADLLPPPADRAATITEAADALEAYIARYRSPSIANWTGAVAFLRRLADEAQQQPERRAVAYRSPDTRTLYCVICARQETGGQPVTADALPDVSTVCDFCGGRVLAVASRTLGDVVARYIPAETQQQP